MEEEKEEEKHDLSEGMVDAIFSCLRDSENALFLSAERYRRDLGTDFTMIYAVRKFNYRHSGRNISAEGEREGS